MRLLHTPKLSNVQCNSKDTTTKLVNNFFMISKQSVSSLQILCVSNTVTAVKSYLYMSAIFVACVVSSCFSPLSVCIIFLFLYGKQTLPPPFHLVAIFMRCFLCIFWVTQYVFPPTCFLCTAWFPQAILYYISLNFSIARILNVF